MNRQPKARILVVEDEESIREGICDVLAYHGHMPLPAATGEEGLRRGLAEELDLVVLDVMLPGVSGFDVCERLRREVPGLGILMLTAKGSEEDVVRGLGCGADDYVTKPFSIRELVARVDALLRRTGRAATGECFPFGPWRIDGAALTATLESDADREVELTPREVAVLALLARETGRVVSRRVLLEEVWRLKNVRFIETRTVDVHVAKLRKKLDGGGGESLIETVRGVGYRFRG
jgi:DNA-binding response OmpR family regulator